MQEVVTYPLHLIQSSENPQCYRLRQIQDHISRTINYQEVLKNDLDQMGSIGIETNGSTAAHNQYALEEHPLGDPKPLKLICIGAGATGLNLAYRTRKHLTNVELTVYEKNPSVGGTWFENAYPGCACDIPSHIYQFLWALNPDWSVFYATGPEILRYITDTAEKFELNQYVKTHHLVTHAQWFEHEGVWKVKVLDQLSGQEIEDWCHFLVNGAGFLNHWQWPNIPGLNSFKGTLLHSAQWDSKAQLNGKRVAVIGNGSSGIQLVTAIQPGEPISVPTHRKHLDMCSRSKTFNEFYTKSYVDLNILCSGFCRSQWSQFSL